MANILISSLGTGQKQNGGYRRAKYKLDDTVVETTFISNALSEMLKIDKLYLIGTRGSIWDSCYREFGGQNVEIELALYEKIDQKEIGEADLAIIDRTIDTKLNAEGSKCFLIEYGLDEEELWQNFSQYIGILEYIEDGDTVYIDISHAFRSLALMSFLMVQFGHVVKNKAFKIGGIYYGMLEVSRENSGITPIVDLKIFYDLMEWIKAVDAFKNYGRADLLVKMLDKEENIKTQTRETFNMFDINLSMANMSALQKFVQNAKRVLPVLHSSQNHIVRLVSPDIVAFIERMDKQSTSKFQLELSKWFFENRNFALSYIVLVEALVTFECERLGVDIESKESRKEAKDSLYGSANQTIQKLYRTISSIRNDIAHQRENRSDTKKKAEELKHHLKNVERYFRDSL